jgi:hypothetical protein
VAEAVRSQQCRIVQAELAHALGAQAERKGDDAESARQYRDSIAIYRKLPETAATLHNRAILLFALADVTGDRSVARRGPPATLKGQASLEPGDPLVLLNLAHRLIRKGVADVAGDEIDLSRQRFSGNLSALNALVDRRRGIR